jgi:hypothetical protein
MRARMQARWAVVAGLVSAASCSSSVMRPARAVSMRASSVRRPRARVSRWPAWSSPVTAIWAARRAARPCPRTYWSRKPFTAYSRRSCRTDIDATAWSGLAWAWQGFRGEGAAVVDVDGVGVGFDLAGAPHAVDAVLAGVASDAGAEGVAAAGLGGGHFGVAGVAAFGGDLLGGVPGGLVDQGRVDGFGGPDPFGFRDGTGFLGAGGLWGALHCTSRLSPQLSHLTGAMVAWATGSRGRRRCPSLGGARPGLQRRAGPRLCARCPGRCRRSVAGW